MSGQPAPPNVTLTRNSRPYDQSLENDWFPLRPAVQPLLLRGCLRGGRLASHDLEKKQPGKHTER